MFISVLQLHYMLQRAREVSKGVGEEAAKLRERNWEVGRREGGWGRRISFFHFAFPSPPPAPAVSFFSAPAAYARVLGVHRSPGAHNQDRATSMRSCNGVFTDQFIFRTFLARILNIFKFHKPVSKTYRPKNDFFVLPFNDVQFSFLIFYTSNMLIVMVEIPCSLEKVP